MGWSEGQLSQRKICALVWCFETRRVNSRNPVRIHRLLIKLILLLKWQVILGRHSKWIRLLLKITIIQKVSQSAISTWGRTWVPNSLLCRIPKQKHSFEIPFERVGRETVRKEFRVPFPSPFFFKRKYCNMIVQAALELLNSNNLPSSASLGSLNLDCYYHSSLVRKQNKVLLDSFCLHGHHHLLLVFTPSLPCVLLCLFTAGPQMMALVLLCKRFHKTSVNRTDYKSGKQY